MGWGADHTSPRRSNGCNDCRCHSLLATWNALRRDTHADLSGSGEGSPGCAQPVGGDDFQIRRRGIESRWWKSRHLLPTEFDAAERNALLRRYGAFIKRLGGLFETGPDVGTTDRDMDVIAETGTPHVFCRTVENGGSGDTGPATALGVFYGMQAVCKHLYGYPSLQGRRVLIQGAGRVGRPLINHLEHAGAEILFSDVDAELSAAIEASTTARLIPVEEVFETECDIFSPCAMGGILNAETIPKLKCRAVAGGANNQLGTPDDAERMQARNILYAPDYSINIGGAMVATLMELEGQSRAVAEQRVQSVADTLQHILQMAEVNDITTEKAAQQIAAERLEPDHG